MSDIQYTESHFMSFQTGFKPTFKAEYSFKQQYIPTRSNTPDESSPVSLSLDNSDRDSYSEAHTPTTSVLSGSGSSSSLDFSDPSNFEIDVRPKRRRFNTIQERILFVEDYKRKYKTEMCKNWELRGTCKFGDKCCFAHGKHELKGKALTHTKYKTKPCKQYHQSGYCPYGQRCQYLHKEALTPNIFFKPTEDKTKQGYYTYEMLHDINVICTTDADVYSLLDCLPKRQRLSIFVENASD